MFTRQTKPTSSYICPFCEKRIITRRIKGENRTVRLAPGAVYILLDGEPDGVYYFNGKMVKGRCVPDGIAAYRLHRCVFDKK